MKPKLELPITLRAPKMDEIPMDFALVQRLELRKTAKIVEGFKILQKNNNPEHNELAFKFYSEININNSKLWDLILELTNELPNKISLIFNHIDSEPCFGKYSDKNETIQFLSKYKTEIISDTFIEIGMIFHSDSELIEIFISESKYVKFWGVNQNSFLKTMKKFNLEEIEGIEFVDEYPKVREPLILFNKDITDSSELIDLLNRKFR